MAIVRKYNKDTEQWDPIASTNATGVFTNNPNLTLKDDGTPMSVEDVLLQTREDIDLLQHNVSWLALHGGGSGTGGGGALSFSVSVLDPIDRTTKVTNIVWTNDVASSSGIPFTLTSSTRTTFNIVARINGNTVHSEEVTAKNHSGNINISNISKYLKQGGTLSIQVTDIASETIISTQCAITVANVKLNDSDTTIYLNNASSNYIAVSGTTSVFNTDYILYWNTNQISVTQDGHIYAGGEDITNNTNYQIGLTINSVSFSEQYPIEDFLTITDAGNYNIYFVLVKKDNFSIRSSIALAQLHVLVTESITIVPKVTFPYQATTSSQLTIPFVVYSDMTGIFNYQVSIDETEYNTGIQQGVLSSPTNTKPVTVQFTLDDTKIKGRTYKLIISADVPGSTYNDRQVYDLIVSDTDTKLLSGYKKTINKTIFEFYNDQFTNIQTTEINNGLINSQISYNNIGVDSKYDSGKYQFRHFAYGLLTPLVTPLTTTNKNHIFPTSATDTEAIIVNNTFSIEIAYHIDSEVRDDKIIFKLGDYDIVQESGSGILIKTHEIFVKLGTNVLISETLPDDAFSQINIVSYHDGTSQVLEIYLNGKLLKYSNINWGDTYIGSDTFMLGGYSVDTNGLTTYNCNFDLYALKFYANRLNVGQIVCSYINNYANYSRINGELQASILSKMCTNNGIDRSKDKEIADLETVETEELDKICSIYSLTQSQYKFTIDYANNSFVIDSVLNDLPLPKVFLYTNGWSFDDFKDPTKSILETPVSAKFQYQDINGTLTNMTNVEIAMQGTTSTNYKIKNIQLTFDEGILFSPKNDWFPENSFTLKADVVDSGHINNATIGKFINDFFLSDTDNYCFDAKTDTFPCVDKLKELDKTYENLTIKPAIEGFPCLMFLVFDKNIRESKYLGVYSFNLGRQSYFNQGYKIPKALYDLNDNQITNFTTPNFYKLKSSEDYIEGCYGICFEGLPSLKADTILLDLSADTYNYAEVNKKWYRQIQEKNGYVQYQNSNGTWINITDDNGEYIEYDDNNVKKYQVNQCNYFWSNHSSYIGKEMWRYCSDSKVITEKNARKALTVITDELVRSIPYKKGNIQYLQDSKIPLYEFINGKAYKLEGQVINVDIPTVDRRSYLSIQNTAMYYILSMLFGLIDSLGKNLQMKCWLNNRNTYDSTYCRWSPTFYDMDSALGIGNDGKQDIAPDILDYSLTNNDDNQLELFWGKAANALNKSFYTVYSNRLFGIDYSVYNRQYISEYDEEGDFYAVAWNRFRQKYPDINKIFNDYFVKQYENCGELLMNYDYIVKYVETSQLDFLHGDRLAFIKNWLNKRVIFLDSIFGYYSPYNYLPNEITTNVAWRNEIKLTIGETNNNFTFSTNNPVIVKSNIGGNTTRYTYFPLNTPTSLPVTTGAQTVQTTLNNSNCITDIDEGEFNNIQIKEIAALQGIKKYDDKSYNNKLVYQYGSLSSLSELNLNNTTIDTLDFFTLFKTWDETVWNGSIKESDNTKTFGLEKINLRNVQSSIGLDLSGFNSAPSDVYKNPFKNLIQIDISNSNINSILIPTDVSLQYLNIVNSNIETINLTDQAILEPLDFTGCANIRKLYINNCDKFTTLKLTTTQTNLEDIQIYGCKNLTSIQLSGNVNCKVPKITIQNCEKLNSVVVTNYRNTNGNSFTITNCPSITTLNLNYSNYPVIICPTLKLITINLSYSKVKVLKQSISESIDYIDLSKVERKSLNFIIGYNTEVEKIVFNDVTINNNNSFSSCTNLTTIIGNVTIGGSSAFENCTNFSVGEANIILNNGSNAFKQTKCNVDDVIKIMNNIGSTTTLNGTFYGCTEIDFGWEIPRTLFNKCGNVTTISEIFRNTNNTIKLPSPTKNGDGTFNNDGLFSPLKKCTTINTSFYNCTYIIDKNLFADQEYAIRTMNHFSPRYIVDDVENYDSLKEVQDLFTVNNMKIGDERIGNLDGFFKNFKNLVLYDAFNTTYIDYDKLEDGLSIPPNYSGDYYSSRHCFNSTYSHGEIKLSKLFRKSNTNGEYDPNGHYYVPGIASSFITANTYSFSENEEDPNTFIVVDNTLFTDFKGFQGVGDTNTQTCRYLGYSTDNIMDNPASFNNVVKKVNNEFPYNILNPVKDTIKIFAGFFTKTQLTNVVDSLKFPNTLFEGCSQLVDVNSLFMNFNYISNIDPRIKFELTSNGFKDCLKLYNVSSMFKNTQDNNYIENSTSFDINHGINNHIPYKLFYHGIQSSNYKTYYGTEGIIYNDYEQIKENIVSVEIDEVTTYYKDYDISLDNKLIVSPLTQYSFNMEEWAYYEDEVFNPKTETLLEIIPNNTIGVMSECFYGNDIDIYSNNEVNELEEQTNGFATSSTYQPFPYVKINNQWTKVIVDKNKYTNKWYYNGVKDEQNPKEDDTITDIAYCCSPDLFRYCYNNANIQGIFKYCGKIYPRLGVEELGLKGRIPPYLLDPVNKTTNLSAMFQGCRCLDFSVTNLNKFFGYLTTTGNIDLSNMFSSCTFPPTIFTGMFDNFTKTNQRITITDMFRYFNLIEKTEIEFENTFINVKGPILTGTYMFGTYPTSPTSHIRNYSIKYNNMFNSKSTPYVGTVDKNGVFYGWINVSEK